MEGILSLVNELFNAYRHYQEDSIPLDASLDVENNFPLCILSIR